MISSFANQLESAVRASFPDAFEQGCDWCVEAVDGGLILQFEDPDFGSYRPHGFALNGQVLATTDEADYAAAFGDQWSEMAGEYCF